MPKLNDPTMENIKTASNYGFSAVKLDQLGATEYTLATIVVDRSGSLSGFDRDLERMIKEIIQSCKKSPRADNLMVRVIFFNQVEDELHGFRLLETIQDSDYDNKVSTGGSTALFDATYHSIEATKDYGKILKSQDYLANAFIGIISDGMDNASTFGPGQIKKLLNSLQKEEVLESITTVLVGMTGDPAATNYLDIFKKDAGLDAYIEIGDVTAGKLAKLARFVSQSISSTSQALGTGGKSQQLGSLTF